MLADFFILSVEEASSVALRLLDIYIRQVEDRLVVSPFLKDPGLQKRLASSSAHQRSIHESWPRMVKRQLSLLASDEGVRKQVLDMTDER